MLQYAQCKMNEGMVIVIYQYCIQDISLKVMNVGSQIM